MAGTIHHQQWGLGLVRSTQEELKHENPQQSSFEFLWKEFFRDPSQWSDNRTRKIGPAFPDFKHKFSQQCLWVDDLHTPSWVCDELRRRGLAHVGKLFESNEKVTRPHNDHCMAVVAVLRTCAKNKDLYQGIRVHDEILKRGLLEKCSDALITMYAQCGALVEAQELLDVHKSRDVFAWTALITGYTEQGHGKDALSCFEKMRQEGLAPDAVTFACILKACSSIGAVDKGEQIHEEIARQGLLGNNIVLGTALGEQIHEEIARQGLLGNNVVLGTALVDMYAKCGALAKAQRVLEELPSRDVVAWSALIAGYAQRGRGEQALNCFEQMQREGLSPNAVTFVCILKACGSIGAGDKGEQIHDEIARQGLLANNTLLGTALVDMYAKCGALTKAQQVFEGLPSRTVNSWTALIAGYAQYEQGQNALNCFEQMLRDGIFPDAMTYASILTACGSIKALDRGAQIHDEIAKQGLLGSDVVLGTALVDMYAKCGALAKAQQVLEGLRSLDIIPWNASLAGYAQQGQGEELLLCFERMQREGIAPDAITLSCVLSACSHLGLVDEGHTYFVNMSTKYGVKPNLEHYTCMVDLFGRAGHLDKAVGVIQLMSSSDYTAIWCALLGACQKWGDVNVGRWAFEHAVQVDKSDASAYVLMANIYVAAGMQKDAATIEAMRIESKAWKKPGGS